MKMTGWKTWVAAIGSMASGVAMIAQAFIGDVIQMDKVQEGVLLIIAGLALAGIGHKIEKAAPKEPA